MEPPDRPQRSVYAAAAVAAADATKDKKRKPKTDPLSRKDIGSNWSQYKTEDESVYAFTSLFKACDFEWTESSYNDSCLICCVLTLD